MLLEVDGVEYSFRPHWPDQEPYLRRDPIERPAQVDHRPTRLLMNSRLTPQGNVSRRVSILLPNGSWYFRDDAELRERALASTDKRPLIFTAI